MYTPLSGKIFITGGAGFLGRGIINRATDENWPCDITVYSRDEEKQFRVRQRWPHVRTVLGDIGDTDMLLAAMAGHDTIIHAAAVKFVPEAELNPEQTINVNAVGSRNVIWAANMVGAKVCVGVSTDKACMPVNIYGATKLAMERLFAGYRHPGPTSAVCVRYGNVVGSTGSIIPIFEEQLRVLGRVTVTDPLMTRFWLSVNSAVELIQVAVAAASERPGGVFVHKCPAMQMGKLAELIAGQAVDIIGIRPGEKMDETLIHYQESVMAEDFYEESDRLIILHPQTMIRQAAAVIQGKKPWTYSSASPMHWVTPEEMQRTIQEAKGI